MGYACCEQSESSTHRGPTRRPDGLAQILRDHGFTIREDERRTFALKAAPPESVALLVDSLHLPDNDTDRLTEAKHTLIRWAPTASPGSSQTAL